MFFCLALFLLGAARADAGGGIVRSALDRPDRPEPVLIGVGMTAGGVGGYAALRPGVSGALIFPPSAAAAFLGPLYDWNTALVFQAEYRSVDTGRDLIAAEAILRREFAGEAPGRPRLFAGFGGGLMRVGYLVTASAAVDPGAEDGAAAEPTTTQADERAWTMVFECGYAFRTAAGPLVLAKAQWRHAVCSVADYSGWTLHVQAAIPIPW
jgi:hypothetical protein